LEKTLAPGNVLIQKRSVEANLLENLGHDCRERVHKIVFDIKAGRAERPGLFRTTLKPFRTVNSSRGFAIRILETDRHVPILVGVCLDLLEKANILMPRRNDLQLVQNKVDSLQIPPL